MRLPPIDPFSFWLGFAAALLLASLAYRFRGVLAGWVGQLGRPLQRAREYLTSGAERAWREDALRRAQTAHAAGTIFTLDEILLPPRLLSLPPAFDPTATPPEPTLNSAIPVISEWPELAAIYQAPSLSPAEALVGGAPLLVLGGPGCGKSTLLAHLASRLARGDTSLLGDDYTPIPVHAADLALPSASGADSALPLIAAAQLQASSLTAARLPRHLSQRLRETRCAILLDGLDELSPPLLADTAAWLAQFIKDYPLHRLVACAGLSGYGAILRLGFAPVLLAPWSAEDYLALIRKWGDAWESIVRARAQRGASDTDQHLIMGWLANNNQGRTIFEVTLKTWAAFAGDARGKRPVDWLEAYVLRHGAKPLGLQGLGRLGAAILEREQSLGLSRPEAQEILETLYTGTPGQTSIEAQDLLEDMLAQRILTLHRDRITFQHSLVAAYCAARGAASEPELVPPGETPAWLRAHYFYSAVGELAPIVARQLSQAPDLLYSQLLGTARWLRDAPAGARWRSDVLRQLSRLLTDSSQPAELRLRALGAFVAASDPGAAALFRQCLVSADGLVRRMAALGLGSLGDNSAVPLIASQLADEQPEARWAAALALSVLTHPNAADELARGLLGGDDDLRRACAEALARDAETGHPVLREAIAHEDLSVRRAAVYGLAATRTEWAMAILEDVQRNEQQWYVRSAAQDVLETLNDTGQRAPQPYTAPDAQGWLIAWAAKQGLGVPPGSAALEVLYGALDDGDVPTRRAAADALGRMGEPAAAPELYRYLRNANLILREAAFDALAQIAAASGQRMAAPLA